MAESVLCISLYAHTQHHGKVFFNPTQYHNLLGALNPGYQSEPPDLDLKGLGTILKS